MEYSLLGIKMEIEVPGNPRICKPIVWANHVTVASQVL